MRSISILFLLVFTAGITACNHHPGENNESKDIHPVSANFKPAYFENDLRAEKIKAHEEEIHSLFAEQAKANHLPGIAYGIVVDNELIIASASGVINLEDEIPATTQSSFRIASMTKSFTAMAILKLRDEGKLSICDPVEKYIPGMSAIEYLTGDSPRITINNLLTMTAGFPEDNPWGDRQLDEPDQMLMDLVANGFSFSNPPSYSYEYSNTGFALLGNIVSRVSGKPFQEYIKENIMTPLHMEHTYWEYNDVPGNELALGYRWENDKWKPEPMLHDGSYGSMGGLITSIEDFSKYVSFHLSAWPPRSDADNGPVKRSTLREMQTPQYIKLTSKSKDWNNEPCALMSGYGFGLAISTNCKGIKSVAHGGALPGFGSKYVFYPDYGIGIMAFCNLTYAPSLPQKEIEKLLFDDKELNPRKLPVSDILDERKKQVIELIQNWNPELEDKILAENFFLDRSREMRMSEIKEIFEKAGTIKETEDIKPYNQLRGSFNMKGENGSVFVYFTLTPEKNPKVQQLYVSFDQ